MPKLPQINVRLAPEHHGLIRELAQRLRADPSLAVGLANFLAQAGSIDQTQVGPLTHGLADEVAAQRERLAALEEREPRMVRIEALETRVAALEAMMASPRAAPPTPTEVTSEPLVSGGDGTRRLTRTGDPETASAKRGAVRPRRRKLKP
jgi:hypothetical protein